MGLFPRNDRYFELFAGFAEHIAAGSEIFVRLFEDLQASSTYAEQIKTIEKECDAQSAAILELLNSSFITPLDREDIYILATELDDIMDEMNGIARLTVLFNIQDATPPAARLAHLLKDAVAELARAFAVLKSRSDVRVHIDRIRHLEEEADRISQTAIQDLFANRTDPVDLIKWLRLYEQLEHSLDRCKKVAKVLGGIIVKNA